MDANAHMANSSYLDYATNTRTHFFSQNDFKVSRFASERIGPVVTRDELVCHKELRLLDEFRVDLEVAGLSQDGVRFRLRNIFRNVADEVSEFVTSDGVCFDLEKRKPRSPPKDLDNLRGF